MFFPDDKVLNELTKAVVTRHGELPEIVPAPPEKYFQHLAESIISQQLSVKASDTIFKRAEKIVGQWEPELVLETPYADLRAAGLSNSKTLYLQNLAEFWRTQTIAPNNFNQLTEEELIAHLTQVKGIGRWTVEMFLIFSLGRPDVFSVGDLGLRNAITRAYGEKAPTTLAGFAELSAAWAPQRSLASRILWKSLES